MPRAIAKIDAELLKIISPFVKFGLKDMLQVIIGASILAIPVGFTDEAWRLGLELPFVNILGFMILSFVFISAFVYYHYHHKQEELNGMEFFKRVFFTYLLSFMAAAVILTLIQKTPWTTDFILAIKRTVIVTFPASMSATVADTIK